jgi:glutamine cyclotransferase
MLTLLILAAIFQVVSGETAHVVEIASIPTTPICLHSMIVHDGELLQSTGGHGGGALTKVSLKGVEEANDDRYTGSFKLDNIYEPEGVAYRRDTDVLYLLTKRERVLEFLDADDGLELRDDDDRESITPLQALVGLTFAGNKTFVGSDASDRLYFLDAETFAVQRTVRVADPAFVNDSMPPPILLLELEWINDGLLFATVANNQTLLAIDPRNGTVLHWLDVTHLAPASCEPTVCVCDSYPLVHAVAFDSVWQRLFIGGMYWPRVVEVQVIGSNGKPLWVTRSAANDGASDAIDDDTMLTVEFVAAALLCLAAIGITTYVSHTAQKRAFMVGK